MIAQLDALYVKLRPRQALVRLLSHMFFQGRPLTTKNRWMNVMLSGAYKLILRGPQFGQIQRPIFILGTGRSGTTILGVVLSIHRDIGFLNEPKLLWHIAYPEEDIIGSYHRGYASYRLDADCATADVQRALHRLYGFYLAATGSRRVLDKYPELIFRIPFVRTIFPDAKFLFLVRNGWDTVHSIATWSTKYGITQCGETHDWWGVNNRKWEMLITQIVATDPTYAGLTSEMSQFTLHTDKAAVEWILTMREGLCLLKELSEQTQCIHYEDLTNEPYKTMSQILEFCELPSDEALTTYALTVLKPRPARKPVVLHPSIVSLFGETMERLGYTV